MLNHCLNFFTSNGKVRSGVEYGRIVAQNAADTCGESKTDIGVDVDLADCHGSCLAELFFRNTNCVGEVTAEGVDFLNVFLRNGGSAVENDRETGKSLFDFSEDVETERRRNEDALFVSGALLSSELVSAVGSTDGDCERVNAGLGNEFFNFFRLGVGRMFCYNVIFNTCENAEFAFYYYAVSVCLFNDLLGESDVVFKGVVRTVDHNGGETAIDAGFADFEVCAVVKVESKVDTGVFNSSLSKSHEICVLCIFSCTCGNLKNNGRFFFSSSFGDRLNDFHVVDVESTDSVAAFVSLLEHLFCRNNSHLMFLFSADVRKHSPLFLLYKSIVHQNSLFCNTYFKIFYIYF